MKKNKDRLNRIKDGITKCAKDLDIHPSLVTKVDLMTIAGISDWDTRMVGGLTAVKSAYFPVAEKQLASIAKVKQDKGYVTRLENLVGNKELFEAELIF